MLLYQEAIISVLNKLLHQVPKIRKGTDAVYHCPYHPSNDVGKYLGHSYDRKPNPGMLLKAQKDFNLDMAKSIFIGDKISDMKAGNNALVKTNILFNKDKNQNQNKSSGNFIEINCLKEALNYL